MERTSGLCLQGLLHLWLPAPQPEPYSLSPGLPPAAASGQDPGACGGDQAHHSEGQEPAPATVRAAWVRMHSQHPGQRAEGARPTLQQLQRAVPEHLCECPVPPGALSPPPLLPCSPPEPAQLRRVSPNTTELSLFPTLLTPPAGGWAPRSPSACLHRGPVVARRVLCARQGLWGEGLSAQHGLVRAVPGQRPEFPPSLEKLEAPGPASLPGLTECLMLSAHRSPCPPPTQAVSQNRRLLRQTRTHKGCWQ